MKERKFPWQEAPKGCDAPIWRYQENPVIGRNPNKTLARVFNSALLPYGESYIGVFRAEDRAGIPHLYLGHTEDGIHFDISEEPIHFVDEAGNPVDSGYQYDPRLVEIEGRYYITWCDDFHGPALAIAYTDDFKKFVKLPHPFLPFNRNGVLFPVKIDDKFLMLSRPSDSGHTAFGDIFLSKSPDLKFWGENEHVMERGWEWWDGLKIGAGANPILTEKGWLLFFHGVANTCNGYVYSFSAALLDKDEPWKVVARSSDYLLTPEESYETAGFVPNVCFPTSALVDEATGRIALYYGAADTVTALCFTTVDKVLSFIEEHKR